VLLSCGPKESVVFKQVKNVNIHAAMDPRMNADVVFYNPNKMSMKLKKIKIDIFIDGKKTGEIDQELKMQIPAQKEFSVPIEVKLAMKELGLLNTIFGMIGGEKKEVHYQGSLKINYHGLPISVPVDYKSEIRIKI
jgi:LEA14-like dessication related protein